MLHHWNEKRPPRDHWIAGYRSAVGAQPHIAKTCRRGCCVLDPLFGSMLPPLYWRDATPEEIASAAPEAVRSNAEGKGPRSGPA